MDMLDSRICDSHKQGIEEALKNYLEERTYFWVNYKLVLDELRIFLKMQKLF